jgi:hypothetical protein
MVLGTTTAPTPRYVLMNGAGRLSPNVLPTSLRFECFVIYGFSDKGLYELYCQESEQALTPYPLVRHYLRDQIGSCGDRIQIVAIDPSGRRDACLRAATMEAVLEAQEERYEQVPVTYRLRLPEEANAYVVSEWEQ